MCNNIFKIELPSIESIESKYKARGLSSGQKVTRFAPSPTGFMHIGGLYAALISERVAHQSNGVFYLRIEDTDKKREIEDAIQLIIKTLYFYGVIPDEGFNLDSVEKGEYGPYQQSFRKLIYQAYVKKLLDEGKAYPCFLSVEELENIRKEQEISGDRPGYYGKWAKSRELTEPEEKQKIDAGIPFVIRFKSNGNYNKKIRIKDYLKGEREFPENDLDVVIMKADGLPTYHFAHVIDDHLMGTTHVIRGDEWFPSLPLHIQLFKCMGWKAPEYVHISPIEKLEGTSRRKLSKRKDPEANMSFYEEQGYPKEAVIEYLLNLANANFEDWRRQNNTKHYNEFKLELRKLNASGALFDINKLNNISKNIIGKMTPLDIFNCSYQWAKDHDKQLVEYIERDQEYVQKILAIERTNVSPERVRKDIAKWSDVKFEVNYFFDEYFNGLKDVIMQNLTFMNHEDIYKIVSDFLSIYNENDNKNEWFEKILQLASKYGYAKNAKELRTSPNLFKGNVSDVAKVFRVILTGRTQTPDLHSIMQVMGKERVIKRLKLYI